MTTLLNFRISEELKSELQKTREKEGLKPEDFMSAMLAQFKESQAETDTASPIYKELAEVKQVFAQGERLVSNFMELAANDKIHAETKAQEMVDAAQKTIANLVEKIQGLKGLNQNHENKISEQEKIISDLQEKAENLKALNEAWSKKENEINTRITELDTEVKESRDLKHKIQAKETVIADHVSEIAKLEQKLVLANQKSESDQHLIKDLKSRIDNFQSEIANLEEKLAFTKKIDELPATNIEKHDRSTGTVSSLDKALIDSERREFKRKIITSEIDVLIEGNLIKTTMKDISASGVLLKTKENIEKNKKAKMVFSIPWMEKPIKLEGRVVRSTGSEIAIKFDEMSPDFQSFLDEQIWLPFHN